MKKNTLAALILTTLAAGQLTSLQAYAAGQLNVWEDIKNPLASKPQSVILKSSSTLR